MRDLLHTTVFMFVLSASLPVLAQQSIGIGTTTPDSHAALDVSSHTKGVLLPRLNNGQQATLGASLSNAEKGMLITDAATGQLLAWTGNFWTTPSGDASVTARAPLSIDTNRIRINHGTDAGDLLTWDGINWINVQPVAPQFKIVVDNHQPFTVVNYVIAVVNGTSTQPTEANIGEIYMMGCNFAPVNFVFCDGSLLPVSLYPELFALLGTTYGGNGVETFGIPDLGGRAAIHQGNNGTSTYTIGQMGGSEKMIFIH